MERLRAVWPGTLVLDFQPDVEGMSTQDDLARLKGVRDDAVITGMFYEYVTGTEIDEHRAAVIQLAVEAGQQPESAA